MRRYRRVWTLLTALAVVAAACGSDEEFSPTTSTSPPPTTGPGATTSPTTTPPPAFTGELARADVPRAASTDVTEAELAALVLGDTEFALDLLRTVADDENAILSPFSIAAALTMTYAGARGDTAAQMRDVLHLGLPDARIHEARNELDLRLADLPEPPPEDDREPMQVNIANSLWGQRGFSFQPEFLDTLATAYDAGIRLADFIAAPETARDEINEWVEEQTNDRIVDLLPDGSVTTDTRLVLANAIWFKANWVVPFDPEATAPGTFHLRDETEATVPFMHGGGRMGFARGDGYAAARLGYFGDASMLVIAPEAGRFDEILSSLDPSFLASIDADLRTHALDLSMPLFEFETQLSLQGVLSGLGMAGAFVPSADFSGISTQRDDLHVQDVVHQAFISVDEEGTEAAAATAVVVGVTSAAPPATLTLDHPFVFLIRHDPTGEILFAGTVTNPA